ncbi:MAG: DNA adenine methylase [Clostridium sp.]
MKSAYYMYVNVRLQNSSTQIYSNIGRQAAVFFYSDILLFFMFRYNGKGEFNVPYGGISYNRKDFQKKVDYLLSDEMTAKLQSAEIYCEDFEDFLNGLNLTENDYIFLDPPYDTDFSTYAQNEFGREEQIRLCKCLKRTKAKILLIIKNTDFIYNLYKDDFKITSFDKKYMVSFMNRNDRDVKHLVITNY